MVSVIVTTKNSALFLEECLSSIKKQTYKQIELIVVDNFSTDNTLEIAKIFADKVFSKGNERSTQRNYGVKKCAGKYVLIVDSDMVLSESLIKSCAQVMGQNIEIPGIIIPEVSFGDGFWANCKTLERSFYLGVEWMEAARFFRKDAFDRVGGFDERLISGEDWEFSQRVEKLGKFQRVDDLILHNEGKISLYKTIKKKFYYAGKFSKYIEKNNNSEKIKKQTGIISRYKLFLSKPIKLFKNPILGIGMLVMKTAEFSVGAVGYLLAKKPANS